DKTILSNSQSKKLYKKKKRRERNKKIVQNWQLYVLILPTFLYFHIFKYFNIYGIQIDFKDIKSEEEIINIVCILYDYCTNIFIFVNYIFYYFLFFYIFLFLNIFLCMAFKLPLKILRPQKEFLIVRG